MANSILITGASGLIGHRLTQLLLQKGCRVSHLGRTRKEGSVPSWLWDLERGRIDEEALKGVDCIIHLAGAGIADKRWTPARKQEIVDSRVRSTSLLYEYLKNNRHEVKCVVSASAIGYYGFGLNGPVLNEASIPGTDFLSTVVVSWEQEADRLATLGLRLVKIRIGIVLSSKGGALKELARPVFWGVGAALGTGQQMVSWIHLDDLCGIFILASQNEKVAGAYNATAPLAVSNKALTEAIASTMHRKILLPNIPPFVLHALVGEMADLVIYGSNVSSERIKDAGFVYKYPQIADALSDALLSGSQAR